MAGWGDDPQLAELRRLIDVEGWEPVAIHESPAADTVTVEKGGERRELRSEHIAFHRYVEGLREDRAL